MVAPAGPGGGERREGRGESLGFSDLSVEQAEQRYIIDDDLTGRSCLVGGQRGAGRRHEPVGNLALTWTSRRAA
jgi:hypothetical protein